MFEKLIRDFEESVFDVIVLGCSSILSLQYSVNVWSLCHLLAKSPFLRSNNLAISCNPSKSRSTLICVS